eukprot:scaffold239_cov107-Isochrysis_galbana.AAC.2
MSNWTQPQPITRISISLRRYMSLACRVGVTAGEAPVIGRLSRSTLSTSSRWDALRRGMFGPLEGSVVSSGIARVGRLSVLPTAGCMLSYSS